MSGEPQVFEYAVLRVIPRVDRGETMNAGILLYCRPLRYLGARVHLDAGLLLTLEPEADVAGVGRALAAIAEVCDAKAGDAQARRAEIRGAGGLGAGGLGDEAEGDEAEGDEAEGAEAGGAEVRGSRSAGGAAGLQDIGRRFRWLTAPRSTVVQAGPVHTGLTRDPDAEIGRLLRTLVLRPR
jgi:Protein of unknown function (DUF3037)